MDDSDVASGNLPTSSPLLPLPSPPLFRGQVIRMPPPPHYRAKAVESASGERDLDRVLRQGTGHVEGNTLADGVHETHRVIHWARDRGLRCVMLCSSLRGRLRDDLFAQLTGDRFADSVRQLLTAGGSMSVLAWDEVYGAEEIASGLRELLRDCYRGQVGPRRDALEIRFSGTRKRSGQIVNFLAAADPELRECLLRVEKPHPYLDDWVKPFSPNVPVSSLTMYNTQEARLRAEQLLAMFDKLVAAAQARENKDRQKVVLRV